MSVITSIAQNLILLSFVSSKPLSDWKSVEISRNTLRFLKILPHWFFFRKISKLSQRAPKGLIRSECIYWETLKCKIIKNERMTSYLLTCSFYPKVSRYNVFQYKISDRKLSTIILKFFEKKISIAKNFRKLRGSSRNFDRFSIWESSFEQSTELQTP